jgi:hypothetical protein
MVNNAPFQVTESLEVMLRHIQSDTETQTLWIDQVCIDQENTNEKNSQVPLMKDIYREAIQTIIWLGPAENNSDEVMDLLADVGKEAFEFGLMNMELKDVPYLLDGKEKHLVELSRNLHRLLDRVGSNFPIPAFAALIARPWFYRIWVVQEVSIGRNIVFRCGDKAISYDHLRAAVFFQVFYNAHVVQNLQISAIPIDNSMQERLRELHSADAIPINDMMRARRKYQAQIGGTGKVGEPLIKLLRASRRLKATDPRT